MHPAYLDETEPNELFRKVCVTRTEEGSRRDGSYTLCQITPHTAMGAHCDSDNVTRNKDRGKKVDFCSTYLFSGHPFSELEIIGLLAGIKL